MEQEKINAILESHKKWLNGMGGERADLSYANLSYADLSYADLSYADLSYADLSCANLSHANLSRTDLRNTDLSHTNLSHTDLSHTDLSHTDLSHTDLRNADIDYSCLPLWYGGLKMGIDDRIAIQILYHLLSNVGYSEYVSEDIKKLLLSPEIVALANEFHRVDECREIETFKGGEKQWTRRATTANIG